jgi:hypothetical protein
MEEPTRDWIGQIFVGRLEHQYRLRQVQKLLAVFEGAQSRLAGSVEELTAWVTSPEGRTVRLRIQACGRGDRSIARHHGNCRRCP